MIVDHESRVGIKYVFQQRVRILLVYIIVNNTNNNRIVVYFRPPPVSCPLNYNSQKRSLLTICIIEEYD